MDQKQKYSLLDDELQPHKTSALKLFWEYLKATLL